MRARQQAQSHPLGRPPRRPTAPSGRRLSEPPAPGPPRGGGGAVAAGLAACDRIAHGFLGRALGAPASGAGARDATLAMGALGLAGMPLAGLRQIHGGRVVALAAAGPAAAADGMVTTAGGLALGIWTADCLPLLAADEGGAAIGAAHAGWRGLEAGIGAGLVAAMAAVGTPPGRLRLALGPAIGRCCFVIGADVGQRLLAAWRRAAPATSVAPDGDAPPRRRANGVWEADLAALARRQLIGAGARGAHIEVLRHCTACGEGFFSHRRAATAGRQISIIARRL